MLPTHQCRGCGRSCTGSRVVPLDEVEADRVARLASQLGVASPLSDGALRRNMGRCCLWEEGVGCRLHAAFGAEAKPHVCRQFPFVVAGERVALDPACPHHDPGEGPTVPLRGLAAARAPLPPTLALQLAHVGLSLAEVGRRWQAQPWTAWAEVADLGPHLREAVAGMRRCEAPREVPRWEEGAGCVSTAWEQGLLAADALPDGVAGAVMLASSPARRVWLAGWLKLQR